GVCLNVGCIPSKALIQVGHNYQTAKNSADQGIEVADAKLDFEKVQAFKNSVVKRMTNGVGFLFKEHKIDVINGTAYLKNDHSLRVISGQHGQTYTFKHLI
ncbi:FAD-dependent oxidoreductase, partial [Faecalibacillus intestinalis]|nr:FAD-dependent oxidoreductase [Faecalibacillus intestinalis]